MASHWQAGLLVEAYQNLSLTAVCVQASTSERHYSAGLQTEGTTTTKASG